MTRGEKWLDFNHTINNSSGKQLTGELRRRIQTRPSPPHDANHLLFGDNRSLPPGNRWPGKLSTGDKVDSLLNSWKRNIKTMRDFMIKLIIHVFNEVVIKIHIDIIMEKLRDNFMKNMYCPSTNVSKLENNRYIETAVQQTTK